MHGRLVHSVPYRYFFNPRGALLGHYLAQQRRSFCALIKVFGPNQFVLVTNPGDPFPPEQTALFSPQTLQGCLDLTYMCRLVVIHGVPESSGARLWGHNQSGALICRGAEWTQSSGSSATCILTYSRISTVDICSMDDRTANGSKEYCTPSRPTRGRAIR